ncbi:hypothetical protein DL98DRAFT_521120 [Cadophora sp. DSE1049]|nr:hypothetical protein DL98DRAFT_521120 [Cadophora sp. DSE1049]
MLLHNPRHFDTYPLILMVLLSTIYLPIQAFTFHQTHSPSRLDNITQAQFLSAPFAQLCPNNSCIRHCLNTSRVFQAIPPPLNTTIEEYGQPDQRGQIDVTFFGICTNLKNAIDVFKGVKDNAAQSYFVSAMDGLAVSDPVKQVAIGIAACFSDTCARTRHPKLCMGGCSIRNLLNNNTDSFDWEEAMLDCTKQLCRPTDVLPYANQDVLGIGVSV